MIKNLLPIIANAIESKLNLLKILGLLMFIITILLTLIWAFTSCNSLEAWVALFACCSSIFWGLPNLAEYINPARKPTSDMSSNELMYFILTTEKNAWVRLNHEDNIEVYLREVPTLRFIVSNIPDLENYRTNWANSFPDPQAQSYSYRLYYNNNLLKQTTLVTVDGGRVELPQPDLNMEVQPFEYKVAQLFDISNQLDSYMERINMTVKV